jgi:hypothetical protein
MAVPVVLDSAGRRRSSATMPGHHAGRPPHNKGQLYPADPPTVEAIVAVMRLTRGRSLGAASFDEPLAAVDVVRRAGHCGVGHEVNGEGGDVGWSDDAPDRQRGAQLLTPGLDCSLVLE